MPQTQHYANHPHRPTLTVIVFALVLATFVSIALSHFGRHTTNWSLAFLTTAVLVLGLISRRYTTLLQDRIIKLEMRYRADRVLAPADRDALWRLAKSQIVALRFASDAELAGLIARATSERLEAVDIKKAITDWQPDWDRT